MYFGHVLADVSWLLLIAFVVSSGRGLMTDAIYRGILLVCGLFLVALSLYFLRSGLRSLRGRPPPDAA